MTTFDGELSWIWHVELKTFLPLTKCSSNKLQFSVFNFHKLGLPTIWLKHTYGMFLLNIWEATLRVIFPCIVDGSKQSLAWLHFCGRGNSPFDISTLAHRSLSYPFRWFVPHILVCLVAFLRSTHVFPKMFHTSSWCSWYTWVLAIRCNSNWLKWFFSCCWQRFETNIRFLPVFQYSFRFLATHLHRFRDDINRIHIGVRIYSLFWTENREVFGKKYFKRFCLYVK